MLHRGFRSTPIATRGRRTRRLGATLVAGLGILAASAGAAEITVQNDSGSGAPLPTFIAGELVAAWLTAPVAGDVVAVQIDWRSQLGGTSATIETAITIRAAGSFPVPGAALATIAGPTLSDVGINEFRSLDPGMTVPLQVPVSAGQTFVVTLEFQNSNYGNPFAASVVADADGCQPGLNAVDPNPGTWVDACPLGVPGDFAIRAVIAPVVAVPAASEVWRLLLAAGVLTVAAARRVRRQRAP